MNFAYVVILGQWCQQVQANRVCFLTTINVQLKDLGMNTVQNKIKKKQKHKKQEQKMYPTNCHSTNNSATIYLSVNNRNDILQLTFENATKQKWLK